MFNIIIIQTVVPTAAKAATQATIARIVSTGLTAATGTEAMGARCEAGAGRAAACCEAGARGAAVVVR